MFYALDEHGNRLHISQAVSTEKYYCPACRSRVLMKKGNIVSHHFYHKQNELCDPWYINKMSKWHCEMQDLFPERNREVVIYNEDCSEFHIADIMVNARNTKYVFEFQHSSISPDVFLSRSKFYMKLGYSLIWVFDFRDPKRPKCLYYEDLYSSSRYKHVIWPSKDRVRWFDSLIIRSFLEECQNQGSNISILFHVHTGQGKPTTISYSSGFETIRWQYIEPLSREEYFIRPEFVDEYSLSDFYARFFTREEYLKYIARLFK